jgi:hypothetical protein
MIEFVWSLLPVVAGIGVAAWFWHDTRHWAAAAFAIVFGGLLAGATLVASGGAALLLFSDLESWAPLAHPKTHAGVIAGATIAVCGVLLLVFCAVRGLFRLVAGRHGA